MSSSSAYRGTRLRAYRALARSLRPRGPDASDFPPRARSPRARARHRARLSPFLSLIPSSTPLNKLDECLLEEHDLVRKSVAGDGNCQFRAIADQLYGDQERHAEIRETAVAHIENNSDDYLSFFESFEKFAEYVATVKKPQQWGDEITLRAAASAYQVKVRVITPDFDTVYEPQSRKELRIAFANTH